MLAGPSLYIFLWCRLPALARSLTNGRGGSVVVLLRWSLVSGGGRCNTVRKQRRLCCRGGKTSGARWQLVGLTEDLAPSHSALLAQSGGRRLTVPLTSGPHDDIFSNSITPLLWKFFLSLKFFLDVDWSIWNNFVIGMWFRYPLILNLKFKLLIYIWIWWGWSIKHFVYTIANTQLAAQNLDKKFTKLIHKPCYLIWLICIGQFPGLEKLLDFKLKY